MITALIDNEFVASMCILGIVICVLIVSIFTYNYKAITLDTIAIQNGYIQKVEVNGAKIWIKP